MKGKINKRKVRQSKPKPRKPLKAKRTGSWRKVAAVAAFIVAASVIGAGGGFGARWMHTIVTSSSSFKVQSIEVTGNSRVTREEILDRSGLREGLNIFTIDIDSAAQSLESHPWINGVTVKRNFPDRILIHIVERTAAVVVRGETLALVDASGEVFKSLEPGDPVDMPVVSRASGNVALLDSEIISKSFHILDLADSSSLIPQSHISEIVIGNRGIELIGMSAPYYIKMRYEEIDKSWSRLETALADAQRSGYEVIGIDLRYKKGAALKLRSTQKTLMADGRRSKKTGD